MAEYPSTLGRYIKQVATKTKTIFSAAHSNVGKDNIEGKRITVTHQNDEATFYSDLMLDATSVNPVLRVLTNSTVSPSHRYTTELSAKLDGDDSTTSSIRFMGFPTANSSTFSLFQMDSTGPNVGVHNSAYQYESSTQINRAKGYRALFSDQALMGFGSLGAPRQGFTWQLGQNAGELRMAETTASSRISCGSSIGRIGWMGADPAFYGPYVQCSNVGFNLFSSGYSTRSRVTMYSDGLRFHLANSSGFGYWLYGTSTGNAAIYTSTLANTNYPQGGT